MALDLIQVRKALVLLLLEKYCVANIAAARKLLSHMPASAVSGEAVAQASSSTTVLPRPVSQQLASAHAYRQSQIMSVPSLHPPVDTTHIVTDDELKMIFQDKPVLQNHIRDLLQVAQTGSPSESDSSSSAATDTATTTTTTTSSATPSKMFGATDFVDEASKTQTNKEIARFLPNILSEPNILDLLAIAFFLKQKKIVNLLLENLPKEENIGSAKQWAHIYIIQAFIANQRYLDLERFLKENNQTIPGDITTKILDYCIEQQDEEALTICLARLPSPKKDYLKILIHRKLEGRWLQYLIDNKDDEDLYEHWVITLIDEAPYDKLPKFLDGTYISVGVSARRGLTQNTISHCIKTNNYDGLILCLKYMDFAKIENNAESLKELVCKDHKAAGILALFFAIAASTGFFFLQDNIKGQYKINTPASASPWSLFKSLPGSSKTPSSDKIVLQKEDYIKHWLIEAFAAFPALFPVYQETIDKSWLGADDKKSNFLKLVQTQLAKYYFHQFLRQIKTQEEINTDHESAAYQFDVFIKDCLERLDLSSLNIVYKLLMAESEKYKSDLAKEGLDQIFWGREISFGRMAKRLQETSLIKLEANKIDPAAAIKAALELEMFADRASQSTLQTLVHPRIASSSSASRISLKPR